MNQPKQFWSLFKFQLTINPFVWFMLLAFGFPLFIPFFDSSSSLSYHSNLSSLLTVQNLFFVGLLGLWTLAPEMAGGGSAMTSAYSGTEFLLTRAVDRPVLYRSRAAYFFLLVLLMPLVSLFFSLKKPDLIIDEHSKIAQQQCLTHVAGSVLLPAESKKKSPSLISLPRGNVLVTEWKFWMFAVTVLIVQMLFLLLYPLKQRLYIFYALFITSSFAPLLPLFIELHYTHSYTTPYMERLFFFFAAHQPLFWILTALALILTQLWCERRFARLEY